MKKMILVSTASFTLVGSLVAFTWLKAYKDGRCDYAKAKYNQQLENILAQQDDFCFTVRARLGGEDAVEADKVCKQWLNDVVRPALEEEIKVELKKDAC